MDKKKIKNYLSYISVRLGIGILRLIPRSFLQKILEYTFRLFSYRRITINENLSNSFLNKSLSQISELRNGFYKNLSEIFISQLHGANGDHIHYENTFLINNLMEEYGTVILLGSHYSCWEAVGKGITKKLNTTNQFVAYKRIKNPYIDEYFKLLRSDTLAAPVEMKFLYRELATNHKKGIKSAYYLIADQYPSSLQNILEIEFLNQNTRFINGPEKMAKSLNIPIIFLDLKIGLDGLKTISPLVIFTPFSSQEKSVTKLFADSLEKQICRNPEYWLWSHKRWKNIR